MNKDRNTTMTQTKPKPSSPTARRDAKSQSTTLYCGKRLEDYSKDELIDIVAELARMLRQESVEHVRQLDVLKGGGRSEY